MSEEERRRRCILFGECAGVAATLDIQSQRRVALLEHIQASGGSVSDPGEEALDSILALIDEALIAEKEQ